MSPTDGEQNITMDAHGIAVDGVQTETRTETPIEENVAETAIPAQESASAQKGTRGTIIIVLRSGCEVRVPYAGLSLSGMATQISIEARDKAWRAFPKGTVLVDRDETPIMHLSAMDLVDAVAVGYRYSDDTGDERWRRSTPTRP